MSGPGQVGGPRGYQALPQVGRDANVPPPAVLPQATFVTSVGLAMPVDFTVANSPIITAGTLTVAWNSQPAGVVLAAPSGGGVPTFRALAAADIPSLSGIYLPLAGGTLTGPLTVPGVNVPTGSTYNVNGAPLAASNLSNGITGTAGTPVVLQTSPSLLTPNIGVATGTSLNLTSTAGGSVLRVGNLTGTVAGPTRIQLDGSIGSAAGGPLKVDLWGGGPGSYGIGLASNLLFFKGAAYTFYDPAGATDLADITSTGINIPTGSAYRVNGVPLSSANLTDSVARTTFTPTVTFSTPGDLAVAYVQQSGAYVKVGPMVMFWISLQFTPTFTTAANTFCISLPPIAPTDALWAWPIRQQSGIASWPAGATMINARNQTVGGVGACIVLAGLGSGFAGGQVSASNFTSGTSVTLAFSGCYF